MHISPFPKVAMHTNFSEHFIAAKAEMGHKNFPHLTYLLDWQFIISNYA